MFRAPSKFISLVILCILSGAATAAEKGEVIHWLKRMVDSVHTLSYEGTFVFLRDKQLETMQIKHTVDESGEKEHLFSLNGVPREVFRDNASVTCITPDIESISVGSRMPGLGFRSVYAINVKELSKFYSFHILGEQRVAGRQTKVVAIIPRDEFRYGYRIYLDTENAFPLKSDMMDVSGDAISQIMFTHLKVSHSIQKVQDISIEGKENYAWLKQISRKTKDSDGTEPDWTFSDLPEGFDVSFHSISGPEISYTDESRIEHFVLSDGLASLSVYVDKTTSKSLLGESSMGSVNAFGLEYRGSHITVVGEVPAQTVQLVAKAIHYERPD